jgi:hypothetical protein
MNYHNYHAHERYAAKAMADASRIEQILETIEMNTLREITGKRINRVGSGISDNSVIFNQ